MKIHVFIHICCMNDWKERVSAFLTLFRSSGLYNHVDTIFCGVLGDSNCVSEILELDAKISILHHSSDLTLYEISTINKLLQYVLSASDEKEFYLLYIHTKGVTKPAHKNVSDWINYMLYFLVEKYETCLEHLKSFECVGVNLQASPQLHYSGNFWWSKKSFIMNMSPCIHTEYNSPEYWITSHPSGKYKNLFSSGIDHYHSEFPPHMYK